MPRIRSIKPEFWADEKLAPLAPIHRLVFLGLICMADDAGRLVDNVKTIDGFLFPQTDDSSRESLETLASLGRIERYTSDSGQKLIQIRKWQQHQKVNHPSQYNLPAPSRESLESRKKVSGSDHLSSIIDHRSSINDLTTKSSAAGAPKKSPLDKSAPWLGLIAPIWEKTYGGKIHRGRAAKALRPVVAEIGETETALRFERYCTTTEAPYASVEKFASAHGSYAVGGSPGIAAARAVYDMLIKLDVCGVDTSLARDRMRAGVAEGVVTRDDAAWIWKALGKGEIDGMLVRTAPDKIAIAHLETVLARRPQNGNDHA